MELVPLAVTACAATNCPTVFSAADGSLVVQGYVVPAQAGVPEGEARVRIPRELLLEAARELPEWS
jgi:hypothetical protein